MPQQPAQVPALRRPSVSFNGNFMPTSIDKLAEQVTKPYDSMFENQTETNKQ